MRFRLPGLRVSIAASLVYLMFLLMLTPFATAKSSTKLKTVVARQEQSLAKNGGRTVLGTVSAMIGVYLLVRGVPGTNNAVGLGSVPHAISRARRDRMQ